MFNFVFVCSNLDDPSWSHWNKQTSSVWELFIAEQICSDLHCPDSCMDYNHALRSSDWRHVSATTLCTYPTRMSKNYLAAGELQIIEYAAMLFTVVSLCFAYCPIWPQVEVRSPKDEGAVVELGLWLHGIGMNWELPWNYAYTTPQVPGLQFFVFPVDAW